MRLLRFGVGKVQATELNKAQDVSIEHTNPFADWCDVPSIFVPKPQPPSFCICPSQNVGDDENSVIESNANANANEPEKRY